MAKGCIQLSGSPHITNTVNMVPVDLVARLVVASAFFPPVSPLGVVHVNSHSRLRMNEYLASLEAYGYKVPNMDYPRWRTVLEKYVAEGGDKSSNVHAL
jgi:L-aminoadipate-semialdehyde dehydrogenase